MPLEKIGAGTTGATGRLLIGVLRGVPMAAGTLTFASVATLEALASPQIDLLWDRLEMVRVDAARVLAKVI